MNDDLFRPQALKAEAGERWGRPVGLLPVAWSRITWLLTLFVIALVIFVSTASFSRKETVRGRLRPTTVEARVFATDIGIVSKLYVNLGDLVTAGELLADVATSKQIEGNTDLSAETIQSLAQENSALLERRNTVLLIAELSRQRTQIDFGGSRTERGGLSESRELTARRVALAEERLATAKRLEAEGAASKEESRVREDALIVQRQQYIDLSNRISSLEEKERTLGVDLNRIDQDVARELAEIDQRRAQIALQVSRARAEAGFALRAPVAGRIAALQISEGERTDPSRPTMTILPRDGELIAEVFVPSRAIGFIETGQAVKLQYDAFPYQKFGAAIGTVKSVSETTLAPEELRAAVEVNEPVYRVEVSLKRQTMSAFGKEVTLQAGMDLSADIVLEQRKLLEWLLEPLFAASLRMQDTPS